MFNFDMKIQKKNQTENSISLHHSKINLDFGLYQVVAIKVDTILKTIIY